MTAIGIDVGGQQHTRWVAYDGKKLIIPQKPADYFNSGKNLRDFILSVDAKVVAIDAPLTAPSKIINFLKSSDVLSEKFVTNEILTRQVDRILHQATGGGMPWYMLTYIAIKGIYLKRIAETIPGIKVIEVYPAPFIGKGIAKSRESARYVNQVEQKFLPLVVRFDDHHQADAAIAALIGWYFLNRKNFLEKVSTEHDEVYFIRSENYE